MVAVTCGELSPIPTGLVYCGVILACQEVYEVRRAQEWTRALARWCQQQTDLVAFSGTCHVHRAELLQFTGEWEVGLQEASRARLRCAAGRNAGAIGEACYRQGELHRVRGELDAAQKAYTEASRHGREPQPGLAMLRLIQGDRSAAFAAIQRVLGEAAEPLSRARLLPEQVEIALAADAVGVANDACTELEAICARYQSDALAAAAAHARGSVDLAAGEPQAALRALRRAAHLWQELGAPYEAARTRELIGLACQALGDEDSARLQREAARNAYARLGAAPDLARLSAPPHSAHGLTPRELEVLRLLATGKTNKAIADRLVLSERTIDRHVSNLFVKLRVSSRAAATSFAYEHKLV
jgi:DNA-binding CsgD family transcriptional regulator